MTDKDSDQTSATPADGVRILGAEEAHAALANDRADRGDQLDLSVEEHADRRPDDRRPDDHRPDDYRSVGYPDEGPSWSASDTDAPDDDLTVEPATGEVPPLPHWTEPPTGAVPAIFADDANEGDDDLDAWATISGQSSARFRAEGSDWAESDDAFDLSDEHEPLGALSEQGPVDEEAEFAEALAARRPARAPRTRAAVAKPRSATRPRPPEGEANAPGGRDIPTALMTAGAIVVMALVAFHSATWTAVFAAFIIGIATVEFCNTLHRKGMRPATLLALLAAASLPLAAKHYGPGAYPTYFALVVVFSLLWFLWEVTPGRPLIGVATTVLAFGYIGGLGGFAGLMLAQKDGVGLILGVTICVVAYDVVGFFVGSQFGRNPIAPNVSPNKTVEGAIAGMVASILFGWVAAGAISPWSHKWGAVLGLLVAFSAFFGDLCESMIKRDLSVKDFGTLLPGHGGVLDRFDGLLFSLPVAYYLALHFL